MVKGLTRRVVIVDSPDPNLFEQAIFIVRNEALTKAGVTQEQVIAQARRVAAGCRESRGRSGGLRSLGFTLLGAGGVGAVWMLAALL